MFSGIVETTGIITHIDKNPAFWTLTINAPSILSDCKLGDSIAVNGICLSVIAFTQNDFTINAIPETLAKTNLGDLKINDAVNLERALQFNARVGGHLIQGHVDTTCQFIGFETIDNGTVAHFTLPKGYEQYLIDKGYIALDGMSLTIAKLTDEIFSIAFIPLTIESTVVKHYKPQQNINIEVDMVGKYLRRFSEIKEQLHA